ncbi:MAG: LemA family protein [Thiotrichales bacterium]|nr:MAG: LemA family protein [Thiotrichales bacterium]
MNLSLIIFIALFTAPLFWGVAIFNQLVTLKNNTKKAWSNIDVLLKQRNSELPKLIDTCKQHMKYEQETLEKVIKARNLVESAMQSNNIPKLGSAEMKLESSLNGLFAVAEDYPELKASDAFLRLQTRISTLEESISDRREFYNDTAALSNTRIQQFPDNIVANMFSFKEFDLLEFQMSELQDVDIRTNFI